MLLNPWKAGECSVCKWSESEVGSSLGCGLFLHPHLRLRNLATVGIDSPWVRAFGMGWPDSHCNRRVEQVCLNLSQSKSWHWQFCAGFLWTAEIHRARREKERERETVREEDRKNVTGIGIEIKAFFDFLWRGWEGRSKNLKRRFRGLYLYNYINVNNR